MQSRLLGSISDTIFSILLWWLARSAFNSARCDAPKRRGEISRTSIPSGGNSTRRSFLGFVGAGMRLNQRDSTMNLEHAESTNRSKTPPCMRCEGHYALNSFSLMNCSKLHIELLKNLQIAKTRCRNLKATFFSETFVGHSCGAPCVTLTLVGHSCRTLLSDILVGHSCGTLLFVTLAGQTCETVL